MASPYVRVDAEGNFVTASAADVQAAAAKIISTYDLSSLVAAAPDQVRAGTLDTDEGIDVSAITLTAGVTYTFNERGTADGIHDPFLLLLNSAGSVVKYDDDAGFGISSQFSFTPTTTGTYYLAAGSYSSIIEESNADNGGYTLAVWSPSVATDAGGSIASAGTLEAGTTYGHIDVAGDVDVYAFHATAGLFYNFTYAGTTSGKVEILNSAGQVLSARTGAETGASALIGQDGTYYVRVSGSTATATGGYTIDGSAVNPKDYDPLDAIRWKNAANIPFVTDPATGQKTAYIYFGHAGENFGEKADNGIDPMVTYGWKDYEKAAVLDAMKEFEKVLGIHYVETTDINQATFRLSTTTSANYGAYFIPRDPGYGARQGIGVFNVASGGWASFPQSLDKGGYSYAVILHEFGHAHGLAHPHDNGGGSDKMLGVSTSSDLGIYDLNQGVYTVMSYNKAWTTSPEGPSAFTVAGIDNGWSATLSAFDIAALVERYGSVACNTGNTTYTLTDIADDANYQCIWDTGGIDTIAYAGNLNARIDLTSATLDYSPLGGGAISFLSNIPGTANSLKVRGGFTIANGVTVENASGGNGNDVLIGNSADNHLSGNGGADIFKGGEGIDVISMGDGNDVYIAESEAATVLSKLGKMSMTIITDFDGAGDDVIDLRGLGTYTFKGTAANKAAGDLTYKVYDSVNGAENALKIDIHGHDGAAGIGGPVTVVFVNHDGGAADDMIVLLNTASVDASDFIFNAGSTAALATASTALGSFGHADLYAVL